MNNAQIDSVIIGCLKKDAEEEIFDGVRRYDLVMLLMDVLDGQNGCCPVCAAMPGANIDCDLCMMWSMYNDGRKEND